MEDLFRGKVAVIILFAEIPETSHVLVVTLATEGHPGVVSYDGFLNTPVNFEDLVAQGVRS